MKEEVCLSGRPGWKSSARRLNLETQNGSFKFCVRVDFGAAGQDAAPVCRLLGLDEPDFTMRSDPVLFTSNRGEWLNLIHKSPQNCTRWATHCWILAKMPVADIHTAHKTPRNVL